MVHIQGVRGGHNRGGDWTATATLVSGVEIHLKVRFHVFHSSLQH